MFNCRACRSYLDNRPRGVIGVSAGVLHGERHPPHFLMLRKARLPRGSNSLLSFPCRWLQNQVFGVLVGSRRRTRSSSLPSAIHVGRNFFPNCRNAPRVYIVNNLLGASPLLVMAGCDSTTSSRVVVVTVPSGIRISSRTRVAFDPSGVLISSLVRVITRPRPGALGAPKMVKELIAEKAQPVVGVRTGTG